MVKRQFGASGGEDLTKVLNPKPVGDAVNMHVYPAVRERRLDFDEAQRVLEAPGVGSEKPKASKPRQH